jgi:hypothetical protein
MFCMKLVNCLCVATGAYIYFNGVTTIISNIYPSCISCNNIFFPLFLQCTSNRLGWTGAMSSCPPHFLPCTLSSNVGLDGTAQDARGNVKKNNPFINVCELLVFPHLLNYSSALPFFCGTSSYVWLLAMQLSLRFSYLDKSKLDGCCRLHHFFHLPSHSGLTSVGQ